jgi:C1A family cysteine protease|nr:lectin like domain-containing protein [Ruminococcus bromii]
MNKKFAEKFTAVLSAVCMLSVGIVTANAAEIDDSFESVTKNVESEKSSLPSAYSAIGYALVDENGLPSDFSSKTLGFVTPIKEQQYNDCWALAGTESFETKLLKLGYPVTVMSHDHANASSTIQVNGKGWQRKYRDGGFTNIYPGYLTSWQGGAEIADVGEIDFSMFQYSDEMTNANTKYGTTKLRYLDGVDSNEIKQAIMDNGAVTASYATTNNCFNNAGTAYFMPQSYDGDYIGHTISVVGWSDNFSKYKFTNSTGILPKNNGAWLIRNSWGKNNSMGGYFWLSYEDKYIFGEKYSPNFTIDEVVEISDDMTLLQNERYGATYSFNYVDSGDITFINCFDFDENSRTLNNVIFETKSNGADYEVYYIPVDDGAPVNDESNWKLISSGKVTYSGYQSVDTNGYVTPLGRGAIGVRIITGSDESSQLGVGEWLTNTTKMTFLNDSKYGDSYIKYDGTTSDLLDWYKLNNNDLLGGTFVIKAVALENDNIMKGDINLDKVISVVDSTLVQKYIVGNADFDGTQLYNADYDGDGAITVADATEIQKKVVGLA